MLVVRNGPTPTSPSFAWISTTPTAARSKCAPMAFARSTSTCAIMNHTRADEIGVETLGGIVQSSLGGSRSCQPSTWGSRFSSLRKFQPLSPPDSGPVLEVPIDLPAELWPDRPKDLRASSVSIGNPHCVIQVDDIDAVPLDRVGPALEHHVAFPESRERRVHRSRFIARAAFVSEPGNAERVKPSPADPAPAPSR